MRQILVSINDEQAPTFAVAPTGTLTDAQGDAKIRSLDYTAKDDESGIYRQRLLVDGKEARVEVLNGNDGKCAEPFYDPIPCVKAPGAAHLDVDTSTLTDGTHAVRLDVRDATDVNKVEAGPWSIVVDNVAPVIGTVGLSGTAREGEKLTCAATPDGQSPTVSYAWLRAGADGSGAAAISGETATTYLLREADRGKKVICRVTATDHGGTATQDSSITSGPFAGGQTVVAASAGSDCAGKPSGPTDDCGDFDGDGLVNRVDADDDNDGVADGSDVAPFDASRPGKGAAAGTGTTTTGGTAGTSTTGGTTTTGGGTGGTTGTGLVPGDLNSVAGLRNPTVESTGAGNGTPAAADALLAAKLAAGGSSGSRLTVPFRRGVRVRGRLQTPSGRPIVGARVQLAERPVGGDANAWRVAGTAVTGADGSFGFSSPGGGRSRELRVVYFPHAGSDVNRASNVLTLAVRQDATLTASRRLLHNGGQVVFRGRVLGRVPRAGVAVRVQVRLGRSWFTFAKVTARAGGLVRATHRFTRTSRATTYRFRLLVLPRSRRQYASGTSGITSVRVLP